MTKEWFEVGGPDAPKKRAPRNRGRGRKPEREETREDPVNPGGDAGPAVPPEPATPPEVEGDHGRGHLSGGATSGKPAACPSCNGLLICQRCDTSIEAKAQRKLQEIGQNFVSNSKTDRSMAFEAYAEDLMNSSDLLVTSRLITLDSIARIVGNIHTMIGAPKKRVEVADKDPLKHMKEWLNGEDVPEFADVRPVLVPDTGDEGVEVGDEE